MKLTSTVLFFTFTISCSIFAMEQKKSLFPLTDEVIDTGRINTETLTQPTILWQNTVHDIAAFRDAIDAAKNPEAYISLASELAKMALYVTTSIKLDNESVTNTFTAKGTGAFKTKGMEHAAFFGDTRYPTSLGFLRDGKNVRWLDSDLYWFLTHAIHTLDGTDTKKRKITTVHTLAYIEQFLAIDLSNTPLINVYQNKNLSKELQAKEKLHAMHYGLVDTIDLIHYSKKAKSNKIKPTTKAAKHFFSTFATIYPDIQEIRLPRAINLINDARKTPQITKYEIEIPQQGTKRKHDEVDA